MWPAIEGDFAMPIENRTVVLPNGAEIAYRLYYGHDYQSGAGAFDYLHRIRTRAVFANAHGAFAEEEYWNQLQQRRTLFANGLAGHEAIDLIVDPPSNSGYHRPFLGAFLRRIGFAKRMVRFIKDTSVSSFPANIAQLREHCRLYGEPPYGLEGFGNVLIVDDVFSTGTIVSVTIEKLIEAGLPQDAAFTLACPLRIPPPEPPIDPDELNALLDGPGEPAPESDA
jgi:hypothetical protein